MDIKTINQDGHTLQYIEIDGEMHMLPESAAILRRERLARRAAFVAENQAEWLEAGQALKKARLAARVTIRRLSMLTGFSDTKISDFENGRPIGTREPLERCYRLALRQEIGDAQQGLESARKAIRR